MIHKHILDCVVHGIVEQSCHVVLIISHISIVAIEALAHLKNAGGRAILSPETLGYLRDGVNADAVEPVLGDQVFNPVFKIAPHIAVVLVEVRESRESAVLDLPLVSPVIDVTIPMVVLLLVEREDPRVVVLDWAHMVRNNVDHDPDAQGMGCVYQRF